MRAIDDKLERHEYRDRMLGEQLKKGMLNIDKRMIKMLDPLKGTVSRLDERLADVETLLMQKEESERAQQQKTYDAILDIQKNLPKLLEKIKNDILDKVYAPTASSTINIFYITPKRIRLLIVINNLKRI